MKIFKFGGASVKDATAVRNLAKIVNEYTDPLVIVVSEWIDIRKVLKTDSNYRGANVDFDVSAKLAVKTFCSTELNVFVTQGFIGSTTNNHTTTLGREGSDYTAAMLAAFLDSESVTVWKDVPGVLNADPKWFDKTEKLEKLTYTDAIELAFYGTGVLHPTTIQPIKKKNIPLYVRSFINPNEEGSVIGNFEYDKLIPSFIFKVDQVLLNILSKDISFITEENLERIFNILAKYGIKANLMQNTAVSFRVCVNYDATRIPDVVKELEDFYDISTEMDLELITIRYYDQKTIDRVLVGKEVILEQHNNNTVQMVVGACP